jgi:hypothetical protein
MVPTPDVERGFVQDLSSHQALGYNLCVSRTQGQEAPELTELHEILPTGRLSWAPHRVAARTAVGGRLLRSIPIRCAQTEFFSF